MGLAASQARLLLLTARKSDLEYRAQCITNTEMILAMQTEEVARKYSNAISNTALFYTDANDATKKNIALYSGNFIGLVAGTYRLEKVVGQDENNQPIYAPWHDDLSKPSEYGAQMNLYLDENGNLTAEPPVVAEGDPKPEPKYKSGDTIGVTEYANLDITEQTYFDPVYGNYDNSLDPLQLMNMLNNGTMRIVSEVDGTEISLSGNTGFTESYYTDDDAAAEAEYKRETAAIQIKEKRLQNDLHQVETQQKACDQEIDSVKKVMDKNIERSFKVFS